MSWEKLSWIVVAVVALAAGSVVYNKACTHRGALEEQPIILQKDPPPIHRKSCDRESYGKHKNVWAHECPKEARQATK